MTAATRSHGTVRRRIRIAHPRFATGAGLVCAVVIASVVLFGPTVIGKDPNEINVLDQLAPLSSHHWLGADALGRDYAARIASGGRVTLLISLGSVALGTAIALPVGLLTGYARGILDLVLTRIIDLLVAIPSLLLAIGVVGVLGPSMHTTIIAIAVSYWAMYARLIRAAVVATLAKPYVDQSRAIGASPLRILVNDVLPSLRPTMLVQTTVLLGFAVLDEATLGFLGLGIQPPTASWGSLLTEARQVILAKPSLSIIAGIPVLMTVLALNYLSDSLSRRLDIRTSR